jgi:hypothetical protein
MHVWNTQFNFPQQRNSDKPSIPTIVFCDRASFGLYAALIQRLLLSNIEQS